jgi:hypothetical protein
MSNKRASLEIEIEEINEDSNTTSTFDNMSEVTSVSQLTQSSVVSSMSPSKKRPFQSTLILF